MPQLPAESLAALRATCADATRAIDAAPAVIWAHAAEGLWLPCYLSSPSATSCSIQDGLRAHAVGITKLSATPEVRQLGKVPRGKPDRIFWSPEVAPATSIPRVPFPRFNRVSDFLCLQHPDGKSLPACISTPQASNRQGLELGWLESCKQIIRHPAVRWA